MAVKKIAALLVLVFLFAWMAHKAGAATFAQGLLAVYGYMIMVSCKSNAADAPCVCGGWRDKRLFDGMDLVGRKIWQK